MTDLRTSSAIPNLFDLTGKVAVVTGSTRGIGLGIAQAMLASGAKVVVSSENTAETSRVAQEIGAIGIPCDVTDAAAQTALIENAVQTFGGIDILVCNAGITGRAGATDTDDFDLVMSVNLRSMVVLTALAMPHLVARGGGSIILLSSISAMRGNASINAYALAKAGVAQLARNLAVQWGPKNVRVNAVAPGLIATDFSAPLLSNEAFMKRRMAMTPLRRPGDVHEIAGSVVFLASKAGAFITGQTIVVDGGTLITDGS